MIQKQPSFGILWSTVLVAFLSCLLIIEISIRRDLWHGLNTCCVSMKDNKVEGIASDGQMHLTIDRLRLEIAKESFRMMMEDTQEKANQTFVVDIFPMVDLMKEAINTVGIRGVHEEMLVTQHFAAALTEAAKFFKIKNFRTEQLRPPTGEPYIKYYGIPNDHDYDGRSAMCHGHLWWLWHFIGSVVADQMIREGRVPLDVADKTIVTTPSEYLEELRRLQRSDYPDPLHFHAQHAFVWQYLTWKRPNLEKYPLDLLNEFCGALVWQDEPIKDQNNDVARECRHSFGHALFYYLAVSEVGAEYNISVTNTFRPASRFLLKEETVCNLEKLCLEAPNRRVYGECLGGFRHSYALYFSGPPKGAVLDMIKKQADRCHSRLESYGETLKNMPP